MIGTESTADEVLAGLDLSGRVIVVTGGNGGIGFETARSLAAHGAHIAITARDADKAAAALTGLRASVPLAQIDAFVLDLASLDSVRAGADAILRRYPAVHGLIANAGVMNTPLGRTADGHETQFGTNHLGHFVLALRLAPALRAAPIARVVCLTSSAHLRGDVLWDDPDWHRTPYDKYRAYSSSKSANMLFAVVLDHRLAAAGVRAYGVNPGAAVTNLHRHMTEVDIAVVRTRIADGGGIKVKTVPQAAATTVWATTTAALAATGGVYLEDCAVASLHNGGLSGVAPHVLDATSAERLWTLSEQLTGERLAP